MRAVHDSIWVDISHFARSALPIRWTAQTAHGCVPHAVKPSEAGNEQVVSNFELSSCAVSVLGQLFVEGPTSEDNITSKAGRCELVSAGLAFHEAGLSSLTPDGVRLAREWDLCSLYARRDRRWYLKVRTNARPQGAAVSHSESGAAVR
jgi:hypothetical protein